MIWFDYLALGLLTYFVIRGFLSGFLKNLFSLIGMILAFLYSGWLSLKIKPWLSKFIYHPKGQLIIGFILAFLLIYLTFLLMGLVIVSFLKLLHLSLGDRILGAFFGFIKGALFISFFYFLIIIPFPSAKQSLEKALSYPIVSITTKILLPLMPESWIDFIKKTRKYYEIPKIFLGN